MSQWLKERWGPIVGFGVFGLLLLSLFTVNLLGRYGGTAIIAWIVGCGAFCLSRESDKPLGYQLLVANAAAAAIAVAFAMYLGAPNDDYDSPHHGERYEPTFAEQAEVGAFWYLAIFPASAIGVWLGSSKPGGDILPPTQS